jgi:hypothetical protein
MLNSRGRSISRGRSDATFPVHRKRNSSSALRSQRRRAGCGNLRHRGRNGSDVLSMAAAVRWIERSRGDGDERSRRGEYSAAGTGRQSVRASSGGAFRCRIFAGRGADGIAAQLERARAATGYSNRGGEMRRCPDRAVCIRARQSVIASADRLSSHNVKNDIMKWRVMPGCSFSLLAVHEYLGESARWRL